MVLTVFFLPTSPCQKLKTDTMEGSIIIENNVSSLK